MDLETFQITEVAFGNRTIMLPSGLSYWQARVNLSNCVADIHVELNRETRLLTATLTALDPGTGWLPDDPFVGLLYPNDATHRGEGHLSYLVAPRPGLTNGTVIENQAQIVFDWNDPINTPLVRNTLDSAPPSSHVQSLPPALGPQFPVRWSGQDDAQGSGLANYSVYVSDNGGAWTPWIENTTNTQAIFQGECGHGYWFFSLARDHAGNLQAPPAQPDAVISLPVNTAPVLGGISNRVIRVGQRLRFTNVVSDAEAPAQRLTFQLGDGAPAGAFVDATTGVFTWTPTCTQGGTTNFVTIRVTEDGCGAMSDTESFTVVVTDCLEVGLGAAAAQPGQSACVPVWLTSSQDLTNLLFTLEVPPDRFTNLAVAARTPEVAFSQILTVSPTQAVVAFASQPSQYLRGPAYLADLCLTLLSNPRSAFVPLVPLDVVGVRPDGLEFGNPTGQNGRVAVVGEEPLLEARQASNGLPFLTLYGKPGFNYAFEVSATVDASAPWVAGTPFVMTNLYLFMDVPTNHSGPAVFYRAKRLP